MTFGRSRKGDGLRESLSDGTALKRERQKGAALYRSDVESRIKGIRAEEKRARMLANATIGTFSPTSIAFPASSPPRYTLSSSPGASSTSFTAAWWEFPQSEIDGVDYVFSDDNDNRGVRISSNRSGSDSFPSVTGYNDVSNTLRNDIGTITELALAVGEWNFVACSMLAFGPRSLSICVINSAGLVTQTAFDVVGNPTSFNFTAMTSSVVGAFSAAGASPYFGYLAEIFIAGGTGFVDFGTAANRRKFITADGPGARPVDLGADGSGAFGSQPMIYFTGDQAANWNNVGSGGAYALTGTAVAGPVPIIPSPAAADALTFDSTALTFDSTAITWDATEA